MPQPASKSRHENIILYGPDGFERARNAKSGPEKGHLATLGIPNLTNKQAAAATKLSGNSWAGKRGRQEITGRQI